MKKGLLATAAIVAAAAPAWSQNRMLDPQRPEDALEISKRVQCGTADGVPAVYYWYGKVYSRVQGEPDRHIFNGEGMNVRQCVSTNDPVRGPGWRMVSREIMLYTDPVTNEVVREWRNPWTGETVPVMHIANDPVNSRGFTYARGQDGTPYRLNARQVGRWLLMPIEVPLFYTNPLAGDYQDYVGNKYHAMEIFDFAMDANEAMDARRHPTVYPTVSWVRISDWMPWMKMRGRQGQIVFNAMGTKLRSFDDLPLVLRNEIAANYPAYVAPPPLDDARPNDTTWTVFKRMVDEERARQGQQAPRQGH
ncbi:MAG: DUF1838 family protein [Allosphingosinicella sp.]|uniref:DUF1838 family protein n=1 Tax=Allosphingosinicella sp. TaxID=2823234 RepID=UPI003927DE81